MPIDSKNQNFNFLNTKEMLAQALHPKDLKTTTKNFFKGKKKENKEFNL
jgi:hypothetical protein